MARAFIGIGANLNPADNIREAIRRLSREVAVLRVSTVYRTEPIDRPEQAPYLNCVVEVRTELAPQDLKQKVLRGIESALGRVRTRDRYAPRPIDLDLVLYDDLVSAQADLVLPDPDITGRAFLALALQELAPDLVLPGTGQPIRDIAARLGSEGMKPEPDYTAELRALVSKP